MHGHLFLSKTFFFFLLFYFSLFFIAVAFFWEQEGIYLLTPFMIDESALTFISLFFYLRWQSEPCLHVIILLDIES